MAAAALVLVLLFGSLCFEVEGFAAWLKCYVDLQDSSEVIMNNHIVMAENAEHFVTIKVRPEGDTRIDGWANELEYEAGATTMIQAKLEIPYSLQQRQVQYVMEVVSGNAQFLSPVMCGGKRAHGTRSNDPVLLRIEGTSDLVELVAGFATGHEAVTLTKTIKLAQRSSTERNEF